MPFTLIKVQILRVTSSLKLVNYILGMEKTRTTPYHPQSDGLVERMNETLLMMLSIRAQEEKRWDEFLPELLMAYRATVHDTTKFTPYHLMFGEQDHLWLSKFCQMSPIIEFNLRDQNQGASGNDLLCISTV